MFSVIYFLLPAAFANMAPVIFKRVNFLVYPVDFGLKFRGRRLLGENKTIRGVFLLLFLELYLFIFKDLCMLMDGFLILVLLIIL